MSDRTTQFSHVDDGLRNRDSHHAVRLDLNPATGGMVITMMNDDGTFYGHSHLSAADADHLACCLLKYATQVRK